MGTFIEDSSEDSGNDELSTVEQLIQTEPKVEEVHQSDIPNKYKGKSIEDVIKMHQEAEKLIGRQAQEVGEVRKLADDLIKQTLSKPTTPTEVEPEVDFFEDPKKAVTKTLEQHPDIVAARHATQEMKKMQIQQRLTLEHPDFQNIVQDQGFAEWVKQSPVRLQLYARADSEYDYDSANELLTTFKALKGIQKQQQVEQAKRATESTLKAASVDTGGTGETSKRIYRSADLIRLRMTDPERYNSLQDEIMLAYAEGRVK
jgi:hypothetical protein